MENVSKIAMNSNTEIPLERTIKLWQNVIKLASGISIVFGKGCINISITGLPFF